MVGSGCSGASYHSRRHNAIACASGRTQNQPVDIVSGAPSERASPCITDAQGLGRRVAVTLRCNEGEIRRACPNRRWYGYRCNGERHWHSHRGSPGSTHCHRPTITTSRQTAGSYRQCHGAVSCPRNRTQGQPGGIFPGAPIECTTSCVADTQGLGRRVGATLGCSEREARRTCPDNRWHNRRR